MYSVPMFSMPHACTDWENSGERHTGNFELHMADGGTAWDVQVILDREWGDDKVGLGKE